MKATTSQLAQVPIFATLSTEDLNFLQPHATIWLYQKQDIIIHEGDRFLPKLHIVLTGIVLVKKVSLKGKETVLRQLPAGEMFAAPALFGDGIAPATVVALENTEILLIDKDALMEAIQENPIISFRILSCFNRRLQEMHRTIHGLVSERAILRLIRLIQYTAKRYGVTHTSSGEQLNTKLPHQQMARMIGITYEECVRLFRKELNPALEYGRGGVIIIRDSSILESLANQYEEWG